MNRTYTQQEWTFVEESKLDDASLPSLLTQNQNNDILSSTANGGKRKKVLLSFVAMALTALYIYGGMFLSGLGMDWGYYLVKALVGQIESDGQWFGAMMLQTYVAPAIFGAMAIAVAKQVLGGRKIWWAVLTAPLVVSLVASGVLLESDALSVLPYVGLVFGLFVICYRVFDWTVRELAKRTRLLQLMLCPLVSFAVLLALDAFGLLSSASGRTTVEVAANIVQYSLIFFVPSLLVSRAVKTQSTAAAVSASLFAFLPMFVFCLANIGYATFFLSNWHAALSALIILVATVSSTAFGAASGTCLFRKKMP